MVWDVTFTCDICGKNKGEANHWWMASVGPAPDFGGAARPEDQPAAEASEPQRFTLMRWSRGDSQSAEMYHLCGQGCAMQAAERFMNEGGLDGA